MTKEELINEFKEYDYDWNATGSDYNIRAYVDITERYIRGNQLYTHEEVSNLLWDLFDQIDTWMDGREVDDFINEKLKKKV